MKLNWIEHSLLAGLYSYSICAHLQKKAQNDEVSFLRSRSQKSPESAHDRYESLSALPVSGSKQPCANGLRTREMCGLTQHCRGKVGLQIVCATPVPSIWGSCLPADPILKWEPLAVGLTIQQGVQAREFCIFLFSTYHILTNCFFYTFQVFF